MNRIPIVIVSSIILSTFLYAMESDSSEMHVVDDNSSCTSNTSTDPDSPKRDDDQSSYFIALRLPKKEPINGKTETPLLSYAQSNAQIMREKEEEERKEEEQQKKYKRYLRQLEEEQHDFQVMINHGNRFFASIKRRKEYLERCIILKIAQHAYKGTATTQEIIEMSRLAKRVGRLTDGMESLDMTLLSLEAERNKIEVKLDQHKV